MILSVFNLLKRVASFLSSNPPLALVVVGMVFALISIPVITLNINSAREASSKAASCLVNQTFRWIPPIDFNVTGQFLDFSTVPAFQYNQFVPVGQSSVTIFNLQGGTTYYYRVWEQTGGGYGSGYYVVGSPFSWQPIQTDPCPITTTQPQLGAVTFGSQCVNGGVVTTFNWSDGSAEGNPIAYQYLDLSVNNNGFAPGTFLPVSNPPGPYDHAYVAQAGQPVLGPLAPGTTHFWRINQFFGGAYQKWVPSITGSFTTPNCIAPPTGVPAQNLAMTSQDCAQGGTITATFVWAPASGANFDLQFLDWSSTSSNGPWTGTQLAVGAPSATITGITHNTTIYWRINTHVIGGDWKVSEVANFASHNCTAASCIKPTAPTLLGPPSGQPTAKPFTFSWLGGVTLGSPIQGHWVDVSEDPAFGSYWNHFVSLGTNTLASSDIESANNINLTPGHNYFWRVYAQVCNLQQNGVNIGEWSSVASFTISQPVTVQAPQIPATPPVFIGCQFNGTHNWPATRFVWTPGSASNGAVPTDQYLDLAIVPNGWDPSINNYTPVHLSPGATSYDAANGNQVGPLDPSKVHYWRVNELINGQWYGDTGSFTPSNQCSDLGTPTGLDVAQTCEANPDSKPVTIQFFWGPVSGAASYRVRVQDLANPPNYLTGNSVVLGSDVWHDFPGGIGENWFVEAFSGVNATGDMTRSATSSFYTRTDCLPSSPSAPILAPISQSCINNGPIVNFNWTDGSAGQTNHATGYWLDVAPGSAIVDDPPNYKHVQLAVGAYDWSADSQIEGLTPLSDSFYTWRVYAYNSTPPGAHSITEPFFTNNCGDPKPAVPNQHFPETVQCPGPAVTFSWDAPARATDYFLDVASGGPIVNEPRNFWNVGPLTTTNFTWDDSHPLRDASGLSKTPTNGSYYWRVYARNASGGTHSEPNVGAGFTINCGGTGSPPPAPVDVNSLVVTSNCDVLTNPYFTFSWGGTKPVTGYWLDVSATSNFASFDNFYTAARSADDTGQTFTFTWSQTSSLRNGTKPANKTFYYWRVWAENGAQNGIYTYAASTFNKDCTPNNPPGVAQLIKSEATCPDGDPDKAQIAFAWSNVSDAAGYYIDVSAGLDGFVQNEHYGNKNIKPNSTTTFTWSKASPMQFGDTPTPGTDYQWRIYTYKDSDPDRGTHSVVGTVSPKLICNLTQQAPVKPINLHHSLSCPNGKPQIVFTWSAVNNADGYWINISKDLDGWGDGYVNKELIGRLNSSFTWVDDGDPAHRVQQADFPADGQTYEWEVYAYNGAPTGTYSDTVQIGQVQSCPNPVTKPDPVTNLSIGSTCLATNTPQFTFKWKGSSRALDYWVDVSSDGTWALDGNKSGHINILATTPGNDGNNFYEVNWPSQGWNITPSNKTTYQWRVYAENSAGGSHSLYLGDDVTKDCSPSGVITAPTGLEATPSCPGNIPQIEFKWNPILGASGYWLDEGASKEAILANNYGNVSIRPAGTTSFVWTPTNSMQFGEKPEAGKDYFWRVYAYKDSDSNNGKHSEIVKVTPTLACGSNDSPLDKAVLQPAAASCVESKPQISFDWGSVTNATNYRVNIYSAGLEVKKEVGSATQFTWPEAEAGKSYQWNVYSYKSSDPTKGSYSEPGDIIVKNDICGPVGSDCQDPAVKPILLQPADNSEQKLDDAFWSWKGAEDADGSVTRVQGYWIDFDDAADSNINFDAGKYQNKYLGFKTTISYSDIKDTITLVKGHSYAWRVFAQVCDKPVIKGVHSQDVRKFKITPGDTILDPPGVPTGLELDQQSIACDDSKKVAATFIWEKVSGADNYSIELSTVADESQRWANGNFVSVTDSGTFIGANKLTFRWTNLESGKTHWWRVRSRITFPPRTSDAAYPAEASQSFSKTCATIPNDKADLHQLMIKQIIASRPTHDYDKGVDVTESQRNAFATKMYYVMMQESFGNTPYGSGYPSTVTNSGGFKGIFQYGDDTWCRGICRNLTPVSGSNIWYKASIDSGAPNKPPGEKDGQIDGDIFNPYAQVERTAWTWSGAETGIYQTSEWEPYTQFYGREGPFECRTSSLKCISITESTNTSSSEKPSSYPVTGTVSQSPFCCESHGSLGAVDIDVNDKPVYATHDGVLTQKDDGAGHYGRYVIIKNDKFQTYYGHLARYSGCGNGPVKQGDLIGFSGNTGNSTGPHLHYEIRKGDGSQFKNTTELKEFMPIQSGSVASIYSGNKCSGNPISAQVGLNSSVQNLTAPSLKVSTGEDVIVTYTVNNLGSEKLPESFLTTYSLKSGDPCQDWGGSIRLNQELGPGQSSTQTFSFNVANRQGKFNLTVRTGCGTEDIDSSDNSQTLEFEAGLPTESCTDVVTNGSIEDKMDLTYIPINYDTGRIAKLRADVTNSFNHLTLFTPFAESKSKFNVHYLPVLSFLPEKEDGGAIHGLPALSDKGLQDVLRLALKCPSDQIVVLVNKGNTNYASGYAYINSIVAVVGVDDVNSIGHEFGHSFGKLGDEYGSTYDVAKGIYSNNCSNSKEVGSRPWHDYPGTDAFKGCSTMASYRPTENSLMNDWRQTRKDAYDPWNIKILQDKMSQYR